MQRRLLNWMTRSLPLGIPDFTPYFRTYCRNGFMAVVADFYFCTSVNKLWFTIDHITGRLSPEHSD
jgi:hypothetical protein